MKTIADKPKKSVYRIRVADRITSEQHEFDIRARDVFDAERQAADAGWVVMDPTDAPPPAVRETPPEKKMERAVMFGVLKAIGIVFVAAVLLTMFLIAVNS